MIAFGRKILSKTGKLADSAVASGKARAAKAGKDASKMYSHAASSGLAQSGARALRNRGVQTALIGGYGAYSFGSNIDSDRQVTNALNDLAFGDPNYDNYVMGRDMSARSLLAPYPGERFKQSTVRPGLYTGGFGAMAGGLAGLALRRSGLGALGGAAIGGLGAGIAGQAYTQHKMGSGAVLTPTTYRDAHRANRRRQRAMVDGDITFGMYNARLG